MSPLCIDLYSGLGGWAEGFLAEGYCVVGFDVERHRYPRREDKWEVPASVKQGGSGHEWFDKLVDERRRAVPFTGEWDKYPGQLVLQDVLTLHGSQFRDAAVIVASPPCQEFSYMAMPWSRAKQIAAALRGQGEFPEGYTGSRTVADLTQLFCACFRIQREACEAAGRYIPMVVENVRGAQPWVGRAKANYGSFYLWGDVAMVGNRVVCRQQFGDGVKPMRAVKIASDAGRRTDLGNGVRFTSQDCGIEAERKADGDMISTTSGHRAQKCGGDCSLMRQMSSKSTARKAASAQIAKIPFNLARYVARAFREGRQHDGR